jgi:L-alanine-DL-glutamate epimerase-like enolase superfamily enzyme
MFRRLAICCVVRDEDRRARILFVGCFGQRNLRRRRLSRRLPHADCRVETDNGIEGWDEATQGRPGNTYETLEIMEIMVRNYFAPALVSLDLEQTGSAMNQLHAIRFGHPITKEGVEIALFDSRAKNFQLPLYRLLG